MNGPNPIAVRPRFDNGTEMTNSTRYAAMVMKSPCAICANLRFPYSNVSPIAPSAIMLPITRPFTTSSNLITDVIERTATANTARKTESLVIT